METHNVDTQTTKQEIPDLAIARQSTKICRTEFMRLPLEKRRQILAEQAEAMLIHYQQDIEWQELQPGDLIDYILRASR